MVRGAGFAHQFTGINCPKAERLQAALSSLHWFVLTVKKRRADCGKGFRYLSRGELRLVPRWIAFLIKNLVPGLMRKMLRGQSLAFSCMYSRFSLS